MAITVNVNGVPIQYPQTGDPGWGDNATKFAEEVASVLGKIGQSQAPVNDDIIVSPGNLSVTSGNLSVGGDASVTGNTTLTGNITVNGNSNLGNGTSDTTAITGILNVDSGVLYVDPTTNKVGINDATPSVELDVNGAVAITGNETVGGTLDVAGATTLSSTLGVTGDVAVNTNKFNVTASSGNTTIAGTLGVSGNTTIGGVTYLDDDTTANTPVLSFTGDTNTGIGRSAADTLDFITNGNSRFRIEPTGQIKAVYESTIGTDYNTILHDGYLCRAWVNFNGTLSNTTGTYTRSGNTITCSISSHGLTTGQTANLDFTSGGATDGIYVVTVSDANTFTVQDSVSGTITTSNVTMLSRMIRASGNVSSITDNTTGDYTVNFTTAMPDADYALVGNTGTDNGRCVIGYFSLATYLASSCRFRSIDPQTGTPTDQSIVSIGIFR